jgi:hypothetical protein
VGRVLVRAKMRSISAGIVALGMGLAAKSVGTSDWAGAGLPVERACISAFGTIDREVFDLPPPVLSQTQLRSRVRVASLEVEVDSGAAAAEEGTRAETSTSTMHDSSFDERFASSFDDRSASSFDERFASSFDKWRGEANESPVLGGPVLVVPFVRPAPLNTFAAPRDANRAVLSDSTKHKGFPPAVGQPAPPELTVAGTPLPAEKPVFTAVARNDSISPPDAESRTAIYDIAAHVVYLPNGDSLEAHSGLGSNLDNPDDVSLRGRGPTPPNVYNLALREQLFHGIRVIRLIPVGEGNMFGRDGLLAHPYMLGPNGQSNGCVSLSDYPAFLSAFLRGEVDRLIVVERLATAPSPAGPEWLPDPLRKLFFRPS